MELSRDLTVPLPSVHGHTVLQNVLSSLNLCLEWFVRPALQASNSQSISQCGRHATERVIIRSFDRPQNLLATSLFLKSDVPTGWKVIVQSLSLATGLFLVQSAHSWRTWHLPRPTGSQILESVPTTDLQQLGSCVFSFEAAFPRQGRQSSPFHRARV